MRAHGFGKLCLALALPQMVLAAAGEWETRALRYQSRHGAEACLYARQVLESHLRGAPLPSSDRLEEVFAETGIFVTLVRRGRIRGCYGSIDVPAGSLAAFLRESVVGAASKDFRHDPVERHELRDLTIVLSLVGRPRSVADLSGLDPRRDGLLVREGPNSSVLLPGEARTASWEIQEALRRLGSRRRSTAEYFVFPARTILEPAQRKEK